MSTFSIDGQLLSDADDPACAGCCVFAEMAYPYRCSMHGANGAILPLPVEWKQIPVIPEGSHARLQPGGPGNPCFSIGIQPRARMVAYQYSALQPTTPVDYVIIPDLDDLDCSACEPGGATSPCNLTLYEEPPWVRLRLTSWAMARLTEDTFGYADICALNAVQTEFVVYLPLVAPTEWEADDLSVPLVCDIREGSTAFQGEPPRDYLVYSDDPGATNLGWRITEGHLRLIGGEYWEARLVVTPGPGNPSGVDPSEFWLRRYCTNNQLSDPPFGVIGALWEHGPDTAFVLVNGYLIIQPSTTGPPTPPRFPPRRPEAPGIPPGIDL